MKCLNCNIETENPRFCSRSCSTSYANRNSPKRLKTKLCGNGCGAKILSSRTYCPACKNLGVNNKVSIESVIYKDHHRSSSYALIRSRARAIMKNKPQVCAKCGYNKHVEVAHVKSISEFTKETLLEEVNAIPNLMLLCPNCHWEFDNKPTSSV